MNDESDETNDAAEPFEDHKESDSDERGEKSFRRSEGYPVKPWFYIVYRPRVTIRELIDYNARSAYYPLLLIVSLTFYWGDLHGASLGDRFPFRNLLVSSIALAPVYTFFRVFFQGAVYSYVADKFGGVGTARDTQAAVLWSWVPMVYLYPLWVAAFWLAGPAVFESAQPVNDWGEYSTLLLIWAGVILTKIWAFVLACNTIAEAHEFSVVHALFTIIAGNFLLIVGVILIGLPLGMLAMATGWAISAS